MQNPHVRDSLTAQPTGWGDARAFMSRTSKPKPKVGRGDCSRQRPPASLHPGPTQVDVSLLLCAPSPQPPTAPQPGLSPRLPCLFQPLRPDSFNDQTLLVHLFKAVDRHQNTWEGTLKPPGLSSGMVTGTLTRPDPSRAGGTVVLSL